MTKDSLVPNAKDNTPAASQGAEGAEARRTIVEQDGFGALPALRKGTKGSAPEPLAEKSGTLMDVGAFDSLPALSKAQAVDGGHRANEMTLIIPPSPDASPFELLVDLPKLGPATFRLKFGDNVIGRGQDSDIRIPDPKKWLSRRHVIVRVSANGVELVDLAGTNGTFVKGERITQAVLTPGSSFDLGPSLAFTLRKQ